MKTTGEAKDKNVGRNFRTLRFGDRTITYETGVDNFGASSANREHHQIIEETEESEELDDQADDGIGTSDDDENFSSEDNLKSRIVIKPDPFLIGQILNFDEDEEYEDDDDEDSNADDGLKNGNSSTKSYKWQKTVAKDLLDLSPRSLERRHSISLCVSPNRRKTSFESSRSNVSKQNSLYDDEDESPQSFLNGGREASLEDGGGSIQTCELRLEEVAHIRWVLTKAELEALPIDNNIRANVENRKVCFVCMKTKFGLFYRGQRCDMCKQTVCSNCYSKTRIPIDHFKSTPVFTLSPAVLGTSDHYSDDYTSLPPSSMTRERKLSSSCLKNKTVGSAPSSPETLRKGTNITSDFFNSNKLTPKQKYATLPKNNLRRTSFIEARTMEREKLEGLLLSVCTDCKDMVLQVIRASSRRVKPGFVSVP